MTYRIAVGGVVHETNTFSPGITDLEAFRFHWTAGVEAFVDRQAATRTEMGGVIQRIQAVGAEIASAFYTEATPGGLVTREAVETLMDELLQSIDERADAVVLMLHGAMMADGYPDVEGEILRRVRAKIGPDKPLALTLDLHGNISEQMVSNSNVIVGYNTYPHVDCFERGQEAVDCALRMIRREIKPVQALSRPNMLIVPQVMATELEGPMKEIMTRAFEMEEDPRVLNVTVAGGFPYSDTADAGVTFVVTTDGDMALAEQLARELSEMTWERRERLKLHDVSPADAVAQAFALEEGPVVLVEGSDNVGGGGPADATHILKHLVNATKKSLIVICDPEAAAHAHQIGVGAEFSLQVGGKRDAQEGREHRLHGEPVHIAGKVRVLFDGRYEHTGTYMTGRRADMGHTAVIEAGLLTVVLTSKRNAPWDANHVEIVGIRAADYHIIVVKAAIAWRTAFGDICKHVIAVDSPGCCASNVLHLNFEQVNRPIYPLDSEQAVRP